MSNLRVLLLGSPRVEQQNTLVQLERRKAIALLAYLAASGEVCSRETLAAMFWADYEQSKAFAYLRNTLWTINKALGDEWAVITQDQVRFNPKTDCDVSEFQRLLKVEKPCIETLTQAVALYRGDFLAGFTLKDAPDFDHWQFFQAENLRQQFAGALQRLIGCYVERSDFDAALPHARRWLALDPLHEPAQRQLMKLYAWSGQHSAALRQYREVVRLLETELGSAPETETQRLFEDIQARRLIAPSTGQENEAAPNIRVESSPALTSAAMIEPVPSNLPVPTTPFIGRTEELTEIARLLANSDCRLLTIIGHGGIGKTRLSIQVAGAIHFPDGAFFVPLAPVRQAEFMVSSLAAALGFVAFTQQEAKKQLFNYLSHKQLLLVLDNFEHLIDQAELVAEILSHAPQIKILVTSRERLNLQEEWIFELGGLQYPRTTLLDALEDFGAIDLFLQSVRRVRPDFHLTPANAPAVARICQLVEGMPLALELAATWLQILTPEEVAREIQNSLDFLSTSMRNIPERHRSLRAVFEHSWDGLSPAEQTCLSRLSIFRGGFQPEAAQRIAGTSLHLMLALVSKSLLRRGSSGRFEMHELLRQYAEQKLTPEDQARTTEQHSMYYLQMLRRLLLAVQGSDQVMALDQIEQEIDNIRAAWLQAVALHNLDGMQYSLETLMAFYQIRGRFQEGLEMVSQAVDSLQADSPDPGERLLLGRLMVFLAWCYNRMAHYEKVAELSRRSLQLLGEFEGHPMLFAPLVTLGRLHNVPGRPADKSEALLRDALALAQKHQNQWGIAMALLSLGQTLHTHIQYEAAREYLNESLLRYRQLGQPFGIGVTLSALAETASTLGEYPLAITLLEESEMYLEQAGDRRLIAYVRSNLAWYKDNRDSHQQYEALTQSLRVYLEMGDENRAAWTRYEMAGIAMFNDDLENAMQLYDVVLPYFYKTHTIMGVSWTLISKASIAMQWDQLTQAEQWLHEALDSLEGTEFPWGVSGAMYVLGDVELKRGHLVLARQHFYEAVRIAWGARSLMQTLRHIGGIADLWWAEGQQEQAVALGTFVSEHPAIWQDMHRRTSDLMGRAAAVLPSAMMEAAQQRGRAQTLEQVIAVLFPT